MLTKLHRIRRKFERLVMGLTTLGAAIVLVQMVWISYGVVMRYVFNSPDRMVTEATALLLFPVAFAGLAFALQEDAYPKVTLLVDILPPALGRIMEMVSLTVMIAIGGFFFPGRDFGNHPFLSIGSCLRNPVVAAFSLLGSGCLNAGGFYALFPTQARPDCGRR